LLITLILNIFLIVKSVLNVGFWVSFLYFFGFFAVIFDALIIKLFSANLCTVVVSPTHTQAENTHTEAHSRTH